MFHFLPADAERRNRTRISAGMADWERIFLFLLEWARGMGVPHMPHPREEESPRKTQTDTNMPPVVEKGK
jgi:hypothetical protein